MPHPLLDEAWLRYEKDIGAAEHDVTEALTKQFDLAADRGDLVSAERWLAAQQAFTRDGRLPDDKEVKRYTTSATAAFARANENLAKDYAQLVKTLTREKRLAEARRARDEYEALLPRTNEQSVVTAPQSDGHAEAPRPVVEGSTNARGPNHSSTPEPGSTGRTEVSREQVVLISSRKADGVPVGDFRAGDQLLARYVDGTWTTCKDKIPAGSPDRDSDPLCILAEPDGHVWGLRVAIGRGTADKPFVYEFRRDVANVRLGMGDGFVVDNDGDVTYAVGIGRGNGTRSVTAASTSTDRHSVPGSSQADSAAVTFVSDLSPSDKNLHNGLFEVGKVWGSPVVHNGEEGDHGIFLHGRHGGLTSVSYRIDPSFQLFESGVLVPKVMQRQTDPASPLVFEVWGDGNILWKSEPISVMNKLQVCRVPLKNISELQLRVVCSGRDNWALAYWLNPKLSGANCKTTGVLQNSSTSP